MFLEFERWKRAARKIVADAAILHSRPIAHRARGKHAQRSGQREQLLEGLHAVKDTPAGCTDDGCLVRLDDQNVALRFHDRIEGEAVAREDGLRGIGTVAEKRDAIRRLRGMGFIGGGCDALQRVLEIACGEFVFRIVAGDGDENLVRQLRGLPKIRLARSGKKDNLRLR